jgi:hypothetical protein
MCVPDRRVGCCLGPKGNGVNLGRGNEGGPGPQTESEISSQLPAGKEPTATYGSRGRGEEESGVTKRTHHAQSVHSLMILVYVCKYTQAIMRIKINVIFVYLFQENKS